MSKVEFKKRKVFIDGAAEQIISGAVHYFRLPRALWRDRLERAKSMGCNAIESYIFWNLTEPEQGKFNFDGNNDFEAFFKIVHELGMYAVVRPGPYTCSEHDNGGLPIWLGNIPGMQIRCSNAPYLKAVRDYWSVLVPKIAALQYDNGGPVIAMQIENEYGGYGHDLEYIRTLRDMAREFGITVPLFTADPAHYAADSLIEGVHLALNFGLDAEKNLEQGRLLRPEDPAFVGEFWDSWFDHWGDDGHVQRDPEEYASQLDAILKAGGNANFYMVCGGTQFGLRCGANQKPGGKYFPDAASYDFDAPVSESGEITPKYHALKKVIKKYRPQTCDDTPADPPKKAYGKIKFTATAKLFDNLDALPAPVVSKLPLTFENLGQPYGYVLYRTIVSGPRKTAVSVDPVRDRASVFLNGKPAGTLLRNDECCSTQELFFDRKENTLDILVENLGRVNYGPQLGKDFKGITGCLRFGEQVRFDFQHWQLPMEKVENVDFKEFAPQENTPAFHLAELDITGTPVDTFVKIPGVHGCIFINGFNLGRYWNIGPQQTLYLPGCLLKEGKNEFVIFETDCLNSEYLEFADSQKYSRTIKFADMIHLI
ncbi:MAG: beta-galactosidase [Lentisphaeria bacterium]|nr:beta-galactosidase [Lentisphaeria bacterium]